MSYRDDPEWISAQWNYIYGAEGGTATERLLVGQDAAWRMYAIEQKYEGISPLDLQQNELVNSLARKESAA